MNVGTWPEDWFEENSYQVKYFDDELGDLRYTGIVLAPNPYDPDDPKNMYQAAIYGEDQDGFDDIPLGNFKTEERAKQAVEKFFRKLMREYSKKDLHEDVENFNDDLLYSFIYDRLSDALDNIAIVAASEVSGYDADWCEEYGFSDSAANVSRALNKLTNAVVDLLVANR